jgi:hypothetical protein
MIGNNPSKIVWFFLVLIGITYSCALEELDYPPEPFIEFRNIYSVDTFDLIGNPSRKITIHFYLIDGDGDIGPVYSSGFSGENTNLELYFFDQNVFKIDTAVNDTLRWLTIPWVGELGQDKVLKADVYLDMEYNTEPQKSYDDFFYAITVYDLALNKSNTIHTDTIIIDK